MAKGGEWVCASRGFRSEGRLVFTEDRGLEVTTEDLQDRGLDIRLVVSKTLNVNVVQNRVSLIAGEKLFERGLRYTLPSEEYPAAVLKLRFEGE